MITGEEHFQIRAQDIDRYKRATVSNLVGYMQEAAWENSAALGASVYALQEMGISWVLNRIKLEIFHYPIHRDRIIARSWPTGHERTFVYRDYQILNEQREIIARATSTWLVFDLETRRMVRVPAQFHAIIDQTVEIPTLPRAKDRLTMPEPTLTPVRFPVRWHDLDSNDHVSNFLFFQWPLEALGPDWLAENQLASIDLIIKAEGQLGDEIISEAAQQDADTYMHSIRRAADGKELARAQTKWQPVSPPLHSPQSR